MSYCRFYNTLQALEECETDLLLEQGIDHLSSEEKKAFKQLMILCRRMAEDWESEAEKA